MTQHRLVGHTGKTLHSLVPNFSFPGTLVLVPRNIGVAATVRRYFGMLSCFRVPTTKWTLISSDSFYFRTYRSKELFLLCLLGLLWQFPKITSYEGPREKKNQCYLLGKWDLYLSHRDWNLVTGNGRKFQKREWDKYFVAMTSGDITFRQKLTFQVEHLVHVNFEYVFSTSGMCGTYHYFQVTEWEPMCRHLILTFHVENQRAVTNFWEALLHYTNLQWCLGHQLKKQWKGFLSAQQRTTHI